jgi:hypothetical protein
MTTQYITLYDLSLKEQADVLAASTLPSGDFRFDLFEAAMKQVIQKKFGVSTKGIHT